MLRRIGFAAASLVLAGILTGLVLDRTVPAWAHAALANFAVVGWTSFVLPLRGLPRLEHYFELKPWERSGRLYHALGVHWFRALVRRGPLSWFNRALPNAWHAHDPDRIDRETRTAEAAHVLAFGIILGVALIALLRGLSERAAWLVALDVPMNFYPVLLQRDHRVRLAEQPRHATPEPGDSGDPGGRQHLTPVPGPPTPPSPRSRPRDSA